MSQFNNLTQDELLHLAIESTRNGEHGAAISYLKEGVERFPEDGKLAYILGAEFAQIGLYDKAEVEMKRAINLEPELYTASFQLGLLQLTLGKVSEAKSTWVNLDKLPHEHSLYLFKAALERLADGDYHAARQLIEQGISANDFSPDLTRDMQNVLLSIPSDGEDKEKMTAEVNDTSTGHVWLSAYNTPDDKPN